VWDTSTTQISKECKSDFVSIARNFPRLLVGITGLSSKAMQAEYLMEVNPDIARDMTTLTAEVPGLGETAGVFSFGYSLNIPEARDFAIKQIESLKTTPYDCELLAIDTFALDGALEALRNPAIGFAAGIKGMNISVDEFHTKGFTDLFTKYIENPNAQVDTSEIEKLITENLVAHAVVAADNPENMINMGKMFSPELNALEIKADGKAISLNDLSPVPLPFDIFAAMNDKALTVSVGKGAQSNSQKILNTKPTDNNPLFSYSINYDVYLDIVTVEQFEELMMGLMGIMSSQTLNIVLREDGAAFEVDTQF